MFTASQHVEVFDRNGSRAWREARIERHAPYRHRQSVSDGYYILWTLPADAPSWISRGGWVQAADIRAV